MSISSDIEDSSEESEQDSLSEDDPDQFYTAK